ncbi:MAG: hypothetical protein CBC35_00025 [Planctomycetes bacterium TMED75]|nr:hypothetical protein [Planctomycetaceae bacterium]OUU97071.1 MAG: hypothetical protein CBC35_00025 [Planctomycetes bacterium TMED75]
MSKKDYYEILGVSRDAKSEELRKAHRKLVRKLHPDVNKEPDAAERFSEVQEAYDVLSDDEKRAQYDQYGSTGFGGSARPGGGGQGPSGAWSDVDPETFESVFGDFFRTQGGASGGAGFGGFGGHGSSGRGHAQPRPRRGSDLEHQLSITFLVAARGGTESIRVSTQEGTSEQIEVRIPAGIKNGATLRVRGKGSSGRHGGASGDILFKIRVQPHPWFRRDGLDLIMDVPITISEAALGVTLQLPLLTGSVSLRVPPGTGSGKKLRASGKGITDQGGASGDFLAVLSVVAPSQLSEDDARHLEELGSRLPDPRADLPWTDMIGSD